MNRNIQHADGTHFEVKDDRVHFCHRFGCAKVNPEDLTFEKCTVTPVMNVNHLRVKCENAFGAVLLDEYIARETEESWAENLIEKMLAYCAGGAVVGPSAA